MVVLVAITMSSFVEAIPTRLSRYAKTVDRIAAEHTPRHCNNPDDIPVWLAPSEVCGEGGSLDSKSAICKKFSSILIGLVCISPIELQELWDSGHCHNTKSGMPFMYNDGRLKCEANDEDH